MNERIKQLAEESGFVLWSDEDWNPGDTIDWSSNYDNAIVKYTELIIEECRNVLADEYRNAPLETIGYFISADEAIAKHFYGKE